MSRACTLELELAKIRIEQETLASTAAPLQVELAEVMSSLAANENS